MTSPTESIKSDESVPEPSTRAIGRSSCLVVTELTRSDSIQLEVQVEIEMKAYGVELTAGRAGFSDWVFYRNVGDASARKNSTAAEL